MARPRPGPEAGPVDHPNALPPRRLGRLRPLGARLARVRPRAALLTAFRPDANDLVVGVTVTTLGLVVTLLLVFEGQLDPDPTWVLYPVGIGALAAATGAAAAAIGERVPGAGWQMRILAVTVVCLAGFRLGRAATGGSPAGRQFLLIVLGAVTLLVLLAHTLRPPGRPKPGWTRRDRLAVILATVMTAAGVGLLLTVAAHDDDSPLGGTRIAVSVAGIPPMALIQVGLLGLLAALSWRAFDESSSLYARRLVQLTLIHVPVVVALIVYALSRDIASGLVLLLGAAVTVASAYSPRPAGVFVGLLTDPPDRSRPGSAADRREPPHPRSALARLVPRTTIALMAIAAVLAAAGTFIATAYLAARVWSPGWPDSAPYLPGFDTVLDQFARMNSASFGGGLGQAEPGITSLGWLAIVLSLLAVALTAQVARACVQLDSSLLSRWAVGLTAVLAFRCAEVVFSQLGLTLGHPADLPLLGASPGSFLIDVVIVGFVFCVAGRRRRGHVALLTSPPSRRR